MSITSLRLLFSLTLIFSTVLSLEENGTFPAKAGYLPRHEGKFFLDALHQIAEQLGKRDWNFSLNPCDGNTSWLTPYNPEIPQYNNSVECSCSYPGGVCHVVSVRLKGQNLDGSLPPSLANLTYITTIDLNRNYLNGTIPLEWASMKLEYLNLENNMFSETVPAELGKLENLEMLILSANNLSGELPKELNNLTNLTRLRLSSNNFTGKFPELKNWGKLETLEIQASGLEGPIPESLSSLRNLQELRISDLREGSQFPNLINMTGMVRLMLSGCNITGIIPDYISKMSALRHLDLSFNNLNGDIPDLSGLTRLEKLYLTGNSLNGSFPNWILDKVDKIAVDLSYNNLSKISLPSTCSDHQSLNLYRSYSTTGNDLDLAKCLSGLPCSKEYYSVNINCGGPVATIGNKVYEADEGAGGPAKYFPSNDHWGFSTTGSALNLNEISADYIATNVSVLTMDDDYELYKNARLSPLSLTYYGRCLANGNYTVTLYFAEIVIRDNRSYQSLGRRAFDIYVQGVNQRKNYDIKNEAGGVDKKTNITIKNIRVTNKTLEIRFQYVGKGTAGVPRKGVLGPLISAISMEAEFKPPPSSKKHIFIAIGASVAALCVILIAIGIAWQRGYIGDHISREKELRGLDLQTGVFTYRQIKAATDKFADSNKLGEGGFGSVYKGTLLDGTLIAVKQLSSKSKQGNREFVNEIGMIAGIQHPNVVRLHGCCVERNHLILVYEYMENNSLAHALFEQDELEIDWHTRQRICVGIAKGLTFLHEESVLKMVHRDIKATNILLDADLTPKISDFGLAKLDEEENTHITTRVAGTIGYMAPEYALWGFLTYKADVYSFGVLALEIVAGKNNMKYQPNEECFSLLDQAIFLKEKGSLIDLVDPRLGSEFNKKEAVGMLKIALLCTNQSPALRPTMSEVVNMLEGRTKIKELNVNVSMSKEELRFQDHDSKRTEISIKQTFSSSNDLYPDSQIMSEEELRSQSHDSQQTEISVKPTFSSSNDLYPDSQIISKEKLRLLD
ncbi:hypothetical protein LXL04_010778 [Taraxacum kok-saghyz]